jgi:hypothetical protein
MNTIRIGIAALTFAAFGIAQASEATEFPLEKSTLSRAEVQADAHAALAVPGEVYDGTSFGGSAAMAASMKSRDEVRMQTLLARDMGARYGDYVGG